MNQSNLFPPLSSGRVSNAHRHPHWEGMYRDGLKRLGDVMLPVALPVIAIMYLCVRQDGGPGFYGYVRIGKSGRPFTCWKLRAIVPDSDARLSALLQSDVQVRTESEQHNKLQNDPRITRVVDVLCQTSLHELPQLWNVLRGDMSLVGPRPVTKAEVVKYGSGKRAYLAVRPGITGLSEVSGRNDVSYDERVHLDMTYHATLSWRLDTRILLRTMGVVLRRTGI